MKLMLLCAIARFAKISASALKALDCLLRANVQMVGQVNSATKMSMNVVCHLVKTGDYVSMFLEHTRVHVCLVSLAYNINLKYNK